MRRRQDLLKSDVPTKDLLLQLKPSSEFYEKVSETSFKKGGQGKIFRVMCKADKKQYALKQFQHDFSHDQTDPYHKEGIYREIDILRHLDDPRAVKIFDIVTDSGNLPSAILELCDGSLKDLI